MNLGTLGSALVLLVRTLGPILFRSLMFTHFQSCFF